MPKPERRSLADLKRNLPDLASGRIPSPEIENKLLAQTPEYIQQVVQLDVQHAVPQIKEPHEAPAYTISSPADPTATLQPKTRKALDMVTFRIPRELNEHLDAVAKKYNFSKTDLLVTGLRLILDRYPLSETKR